MSVSIQSELEKCESQSLDFHISKSQYVSFVIVQNGLDSQQSSSAKSSSSELSFGFNSDKDDDSFVKSVNK